MQKLSINQINYLNIFLMFLSALLAWYRPFETFLFVYAVLGPLHYLTEINWLHDKQYFTKRKYDFIFLLLAGIALTLFSLEIIKTDHEDFVTTLIVLSFFFALIFALISNVKGRLFLFLPLTILSAWIANLNGAGTIFGTFLPTLIHVFIFTGLFILMGAVKSRKLSALVSLLFFIICGVSLFILLPHTPGREVGEYVRSSYGHFTGNGLTDGFIGLNYEIINTFKLYSFQQTSWQDSQQFINSMNSFFYHHPLALSLMSFIAFAYTYHYLNWFSKTSVIQWHDTTWWRFSVVILFWLISLAIYIYSYSLGLKWLYFLSLTHVLLEFPLNHLTFIHLMKEIKLPFMKKGLSS